MKEYFRHKILNVVNIKGLAAVEFLTFGTGYREIKEKHDFWELCYVENGDVFVCFDDQKVHLEEKQFFLMPPNLIHSYLPVKGKNSNAFVLCFESFSNILNPISTVAFNLSDDEAYCMEKVMDEVRNTFTMNSNGILEVIPSPNFGGEQAILLQLEYLLISLTRKLSASGDHSVVFLSDKKFYADLVNVIISFLGENVSKKVSLNDICDRINCSRSFLCKIFKEQTGETVFSYFNKMKIREAKNMLAETSLSISEVSYALGFDELKYFDFFFKKYVGETPNSYRKKNKKENTK